MKYKNSGAKMLNITANEHRNHRRENHCLLYIAKKQAGFFLFLIIMLEVKLAIEFRNKIKY
jgi:hypothetical protein